MLDPSNFKTALMQAKGGETFDLKPGDYGSLDLALPVYPKPVTVRSADPHDKARLGRTLIRKGGNVAWRTLDWSNPLKSGDPNYTPAVRIYTSEDMTFDDVGIYGSLDGDQGNDGQGMVIADSKRLKITGSRFRQFFHGLGISRSEDVEITGNDFSELVSDGIQFGVLKRALIGRNRMWGWKITAGVHPDGIQGMTANAKASCEDVEISENLIIGAVGAQPQGIFVTDQMGGAFPYKRMNIHTNLIVGAAWNGLTLHQAVESRIVGNRLLTADGGVGACRLWLSVVSGAAGDNIAKAYILQSVDNLAQSNNQTNGFATEAEIAAAIAEWDAKFRGATPVPVPPTPPPANDPCADVRATLATAQTVLTRQASEIETLKSSLFAANELTATQAAVIEAVRKAVG